MTLANDIAVIPDIISDEKVNGSSSQTVRDASRKK